MLSYIDLIIIIPAESMYLKARLKKRESIHWIKKSAFFNYVSTLIFIAYRPSSFQAACPALQIPVFP
jgi:hypothetical protein